MKKQCCQLSKTKSFKERNPDLDIEGIQNNPHVPDDIKEVLSNALTICTDDEEEEEEDIDKGTTSAFIKNDEEEIDIAKLSTKKKIILETNYDPFEDSGIMIIVI